MKMNVMSFSTIVLMMLLSVFQCGRAAAAFPGITGRWPVAFGSLPNACSVVCCGVGAIMFAASCRELQAGSLRSPSRTEAKLIIN
jgi:hypothetical protein